MYTLQFVDIYMFWDNGIQILTKWEAKTNPMISSARPGQDWATRSVCVAARLPAKMMLFICEFTNQVNIPHMTMMCHALCQVNAA